VPQPTHPRPVCSFGARVGHYGEGRMDEIRIFNNAADALCYLTECTLATVESLEIQKRPPKGETARQKNMAEIGIRNLRAHKYTIDDAQGIKCFRVGDALARVHS